MMSYLRIKLSGKFIQEHFNPFRNNIIMGKIWIEETKPVDLEDSILILITVVGSLNSMLSKMIEKYIIGSCTKSNYVKEVHFSYKIANSFLSAIFSSFKVLAPECDSECWNCVDVRKLDSLSDFFKYVNDILKCLIQLEELMKSVLHSCTHLLNNNDMKSVEYLTKIGLKILSEDIQVVENTKVVKNKKMKPIPNKEKEKEYALKYVQESFDRKRKNNENVILPPKKRKY